MRGNQRLRWGTVALVIVLGCAPRRGEGVTTVKEPPAPPATTAPAPKQERPSSCVLEGDGEPLDRLLFHKEPELVIFGGRADSRPLLRVEGSGRYTLRGRWSELPEATGDGRARLELTRVGAFRVEGYAELAATRFRLRRRSPVVEGHVWLEADFLVRLVGLAGARVQVMAPVPFAAPRELSLQVACEDLAYDDRRERAPHAPDPEARAHVDRLQLHAAPAGQVVFAADSRLFFVAVEEERAGFARIRGERYGVQVAGWTPLALVSHTPQGSGGPGGSRHGHGSSSKGKVVRVLHATPLVAERGSAHVVVGEVAAGAAVRVLGAPSDDGWVSVELVNDEVRAVADVTLRIRAAELVAPTPP